MAYQFVTTRSGQEYAVDWDVIERLVMSYWQTYYQIDLYDKVTLSQSSWSNPFSWSMPDVVTLEVEWDAVRDFARRATSADMVSYTQRAAQSMYDIAFDIEYKVKRTAAQRAQFTNILKDVQQQNLQAMEKSVKDYDGLIDASRFIRDTSADVVAIGSTIATGGAASGLLAGSSAMKGFGKYQDTGNVGAAALYGAGSMFLGAFKISGAKLTTAGEYVLIVAQGTLEAGTSLAAGDSFGKALSTGGLKIASSGAAQALFGGEWIKKIFKKLPVPFNVWTKVIDTDVEKRFVDEANDVVAKVAKKGFEKGTKKMIKDNMSGDPEPGAPNTVQSGLMDDVPVENLVLLYFSIVNMKLGIGRGW